MRAAAVALLLLLSAAFASESALARKGGGVRGQIAASTANHASGHRHVNGHRPIHSHVNGHRHGHPHHGHHHGHHHHKHVVGVGFGVVVPAYWYYPPPYYYPPYYSQPVGYPAQPVTYVEQSGAAAAEPVGWWYYCEPSRTYYPYIKECPSAWHRVPALPPPPN